MCPMRADIYTEMMEFFDHRNKNKLLSQSLTSCISSHMNEYAKAAWNFLCFDPFTRIAVHFDISSGVPSSKRSDRINAAHNKMCPTSASESSCVKIIKEFVAFSWCKCEHVPCY